MEREVALLKELRGDERTPLQQEAVKIIQDVAATGQYVHPWPMLRPLLCRRITEVVTALAMAEAGLCPLLALYVTSAQELGSLSNLQTPPSTAGPLSVPGGSENRQDVAGSAGHDVDGRARVTLFRARNSADVALGVENVSAGTLSDNGSPFRQLRPDGRDVTMLQSAGQSDHLPAMHIGSTTAATFGRQESRQPDGQLNAEPPPGSHEPTLTGEDEPMVDSLGGEIKVGEKGNAVDVSSVEYGGQDVGGTAGREHAAGGNSSKLNCATAGPSPPPGRGRLALEAGIGPSSGTLAASLSLSSGAGATDNASPSPRASLSDGSGTCAADMSIEFRMDSFLAQDMEDLCARLDEFANAPWSIQRICEILGTPRRYYNRTKNLTHALQKCLAVSDEQLLSSVPRTLPGLEHSAYSQVWPMTRSPYGRTVIAPAGGSPSHALPQGSGMENADARPILPVSPMVDIIQKGPGTRVGFPTPTTGGKSGQRLAALPLPAAASASPSLSLLGRSLVGAAYDDEESDSSDSSDSDEEGINMASATKQEVEMYATLKRIARSLGIGSGTIVSAQGTSRSMPGAGRGSEPGSESDGRAVAMAASLLASASAGASVTAAQPRQQPQPATQSVGSMHVRAHVHADTTINVGRSAGADDFDLFSDDLDDAAADDNGLGSSVGGAGADDDEEAFALPERRAESQDEEDVLMALATASSRSPAKVQHANRPTSARGLIPLSGKLDIVRTSLSVSLSASASSALAVAAPSLAGGLALGEDDGEESEGGWTVTAEGEEDGGGDGNQALVEEDIDNSGWNSLQHSRSHGAAGADLQPEDDESKWTSVMVDEEDLDAPLSPQAALARAPLLGQSQQGSAGGIGAGLGLGIGSMQSPISPYKKARPDGASPPGAGMGAGSYKTSGTGPAAWMSRPPSPPAVGMSQSLHSPQPLPMWHSSGASLRAGLGASLETPTTLTTTVGGLAALPALPLSLGDARTVPSVPRPSSAQYAAAAGALYTLGGDGRSRSPVPRLGTASPAGGGGGWAGGGTPPSIGGATGDGTVGGLRRGPVAPAPAWAVSPGGLGLGRLVAYRDDDELSDESEDAEGAAGVGVPTAPLCRESEACSVRGGGAPPARRSRDAAEDAGAAHELHAQRPAKRARVQGEGGQVLITG